VLNGLGRNRIDFSRLKKNSPLKDLLFGILAAILALVLSLWIFKESITQIFHHSIPLGGDGSLTGFYLSLVERNSFWNLLTQHITSSSYGWPSHLDFTNYPIGQTLEMMLLKVWTSFFGVANPASVIHVISILKVIPVSITAYVFARTLGTKYFFAAIAGAAYGISNFNLIRSEGHFFLALTWSVPLAMSAILLGYKEYRESKISAPITNHKKFVWKVCFLSFFSAFSSYYYSIFILLAYVFILFIIFAHEISELKGGRRLLQRFKCWRQIIQSCRSLTVGFVISLIGFCFQIFPILIRTSGSSQLANISDRSWTESIVYGGTLESYFFDLSNLITRALNHFEMPPFLETRTNWEAAQSGSTAGLLGYMIITAVILFIVRSLLIGRVDLGKSRFLHDNNLLFLIGMFIFFFSLYLVSPLNFMISRLLPEIRAWGRVSTILCLISITGICYFASKIDKKIYGYGLILLVVIIPTVGDAKIFHDSRPTAVQLNLQALNDENRLSTTWETLKSNFKKGCSIVNIPIYPFPEFDNPKDNNGDYAQLPLVSFDENYFRWSYPAIKDTVQSQYFQNLASEQPNFNRASLDDQISAARSLNACGVVVDRTLLVPSETKRFNSMVGKNVGCFLGLGGEQYLNHSRFYSLSFSSTFCSREILQNSQSTDSSPVDSRVLWKIDQPFSLEYLDGEEIFGPSSSIGFRIAAVSPSHFYNANIHIKVVLKAANIEPPVIKACVTSPKMKNPLCGSLGSSDHTEIILQVPGSVLSNKFKEFTASLVTSDFSKIQAWGLTVN